MKQVIITVPYWLGTKERYTGSVEAALDRGIAEELGVEVVSLAPQFADNVDPVVAVNRALAEAIAEHSKHAVPLVLAGDCTNCWGVTKGLQAQQSPHILWLDAHGDFNTPETSPSGFLGGMPLAALVGRGNQSMIEAIGLQLVPEEQITISDARDLDPEEGAMLRESALTHLPELRDLAQQDWQGKPLYIHFDGDVLRLDDHPAVSYPAKGGPSLEEAIAALRHVIAQADVKAVLFTMGNAKLENAEKSTETMLSVVRAVSEALSA